MTANEDLAQIAKEVSGCKACSLHSSRKNSVPGEGPADASLLFIGEGPGFHENEQGRPFVGAAGKFLEELLASIKMRREQVFICNVVKCRPPGNRDPQPDEIEACRGYLETADRRDPAESDRHPGTVFDGPLFRRVEDQFRPRPGQKCRRPAGGGDVPSRGGAASAGAETIHRGRLPQTAGADRTSAQAGPLRTHTPPEATQTPLRINRSGKTCVYPAPDGVRLAVSCPADCRGP